MRRIYYPTTVTGSQSGLPCRAPLLRLYRRAGYRALLLERLWNGRDYLTIAITVVLRQISSRQGSTAFMCMESPTHSCSIPNFAAPLLLLSCQRRKPTHSCTKNLRSNLHKFKRTRRQPGCGWSAPAHIAVLQLRHLLQRSSFDSRPGHYSSRWGSFEPHCGHFDPTYPISKVPKGGLAADGPHLHQTVSVATVPAGVLVRLERGPAAILVEIALHGCGWSAPAPNDNGLLCIGTISVSNRARAIRWANKA
ncbi:hypothetical protein C8R47DRAFT_312496 [Mycena vitilis]|nr:hypothetical protein C8R47DRAFT_312496 [Mycena vitilis]